MLSVAWGGVTAQSFSPSSSSSFSSLTPDNWGCGGTGPCSAPAPWRGSRAPATGREQVRELRDCLYSAETRERIAEVARGPERSGRTALGKELRVVEGSLAG